MIPILEAPIHDWYCPQCGKTDQTREVRPHTRYHPCPKLRFMSVPLLPKGTAAKIEIREREDYVGREQVQVDPELGRPVMSIITTRDNGNDCMVFAPVAAASLRVGD